MGSFAEFNTENMPERDIRLAVAVPVKVISHEVGVAPQWSCTYEVSARGARLKHVRGVSWEGQEILIKRNSSMSRFRVTWIGDHKSAEAGHAAVAFDQDLLAFPADAAAAW